VGRLGSPASKRVRWFGDEGEGEKRWGGRSSSGYGSGWVGGGFGGAGNEGIGGGREKAGGCVGWRPLPAESVRGGGVPEVVCSCFWILRGPMVGVSGEVVS
jgi:hypothetical protein